MRVRYSQSKNRVRYYMYYTTSTINTAVVLLYRTWDNGASTPTSDSAHARYGQDWYDCIVVLRIK